jgi:Beta-lactamase
MPSARFLATLALYISQLLAPVFALSQETPALIIHKCPPGMVLTCYTETNPPVCSCIAGPAPTYPVNGLVTGLTGKGAQLYVSDADVDNPLLIGVYKNGPISFGVPAGPYSIQVITEPNSPAQACVLTNPTGAAPVPTSSTPFTLACSAGFTVGGTVAGAAPGNLWGGWLSTPNTAVGSQVVLANPYSNNGPFTFPAPTIADGQPYQVTSSGMVGGQTCILANGSGTIHGANVTDVTISCQDVVACDERGCISEIALSNKIVNALTNTESLPDTPAVAGYVVMVGTVPPISAGQARIAPDPNPLAMSPDLQMNIASISKTLTAIAIMQLLAKDAPAGMTVADMVNTKIKDYVYTDWPLGKNVEDVTFAELLNHTSGFAQLDQEYPGYPCAGGNTYAQVRTLVANGLPNNPPPQPPGYGNCNFSLLRELLPALYYAKDNNPNPVQKQADGDARAQASSNLYISYLNSQVFAPLGISNRACQSDGVTEVLAYPFPAVPPGLDMLSGQGDWLSCGAQGWSLSAADVFKVINDLATGNVLLTKDEKSLMGNPNCFGWDCKRGDCPNPYVCKNGGQGTSSIQVATYAGILKCVPIVVFVNSLLPWPYQPPEVNGKGDIIDLVSDAFNASAVSGTPKPCP